jgi:hypothetical protein
MRENAYCWNEMQTHIHSLFCGSTPAILASRPDKAAYSTPAPLIMRAVLRTQQLGLLDFLLGLLAAVLRLS